MFKQVTADNILNWGGRLNRLPGAQRSMGDSEGHKYWGVEPPASYTPANWTPLVVKFQEIKLGKGFLYIIALFCYSGLAFNALDGWVTLGQSPQNFAWRSEDGQCTQH